MRGLRPAGTIVCALLGAAVLVAGAGSSAARVSADGEYWSRPWGVKLQGVEARLTLTPASAAVLAEWQARAGGIAPGAQPFTGSCEVYFTGTYTWHGGGTLVGCTSNNPTTNAYSHDNRLLALAKDADGQIGPVSGLQGDGETVQLTVSYGCRSAGSSGYSGCTALYSSARFARLDCLDAVATIIAEAGVDTVGTPGNDVIVGGPGNDVIKGGGGDDTICGWRGNDLLAGGDGRDRIDGGGGADILNGGDGDDLLRAGAGNVGAVLFGGDGD